MRHEKSNFEGPGIRIGHLRFESNLSDLLVCLVKEPAGVRGESESDTQIVGEKVYTFDNASRENDVSPETSEARGTSAF
jgi:hypothetical protein